MKRYFFILIVFQFCVGYSQDMYQIDYIYTDVKGYSCTSSLFTNNKESVFKIYDTRKGGLVEKGDDDLDYIANDPLSSFFYADSRVAYHRFSIYDTEILYSDEYASKLNWHIHAEKTKTIGKYKCTEADVRINGRNYTVWFTFDVPIKCGPLKLHNLPGLIVEVTEEKGFLKIKLDQITKASDRSEFEKYKQYFLKRKKIDSYKQYEDRIIKMEISIRLSCIALCKKLSIRGDVPKDTFKNDKKHEDYLEVPTHLESKLKEYVK